MPEHVDIIDPDIHEPKGVADASANTVYIADGSGSGAWNKIGSSQVDTTSVFNANKFILLAELDDVSTADSILIVVPVAATLTAITSVLHAAITTADATITITNSVGPSTLGTITVTEASSAEGDTDSLIPSSNNTFTAGSYVKIATDGGSTGTAKITFSLQFTQTA